MMANGDSHDVMTAK